MISSVPPAASQRPLCPENPAYHQPISFLLKWEQHIFMVYKHIIPQRRKHAAPGSMRRQTFLLSTYTDHGVPMKNK